MTYTVVISVLKMKNDENVIMMNYDLLLKKDWEIKKLNGMWKSPCNIKTTNTDQ